MSVGHSALTGFAFGLGILLLVDTVSPESTNLPDLGQPVDNAEQAIGPRSEGCISDLTENRFDRAELTQLLQQIQFPIPWAEVVSVLGQPTCQLTSASDGRVRYGWLFNADESTWLVIYFESNSAGGNATGFDWEL
jgi:hypothetical protein